MEEKIASWPDGNIARAMQSCLRDLRLIIAGELTEDDAPIYTTDCYLGFLDAFAAELATRLAPDDRWGVGGARRPPLLRVYDGGLLDDGFAREAARALAQMAAERDGE